MRRFYAVTLAFFLFSPFAVAQERKTFTVPFHTVRGMILLDGQVNGKPAVLLLDTGANNSLVDIRFADRELDKQRYQLRSSGNTGSQGTAFALREHIALGLRSWDRVVGVMDLSDASKRVGAHVDGFIGADVLSEFSAVRIDYKAHTLELEQ